MADLTDYFGRQFHRPFADMTGLTGLYDFKLTWPAMILPRSRSHRNFQAAGESFGIWMILHCQACRKLCKTNWA
jgi:uncharacterized protein (TIGR03435 family)